MKDGAFQVFLRAAILPLGIMAAAPLSLAATAEEEAPRAYCARVVDDDLLRRPPPSLAGPIRRLFGISGKYALETTYYRCASGKVRLCTIGANLPCAKANTSTVLPAATDWCRTNRNSDSIPLAVTGHDTLYVWRCVGGIAKPVGKIGRLDGRGFFANYWKTLQ